MDVSALAPIVPLEQMTAAAQWLNNTFASFDYKILEFYNTLHNGALGGFLDIFFKYFTRLGDGGIFVLLIGFILLLFAKTRKVGLGMIGGVVIGALFTNVAIKNIVARPRPYMADETYRQWWLSVAHGLESEYSFPSGHTTSVMAAMTPVFAFCNKKKSWLVFIFVILIGASRNYIFVHYPSDIIGGLIVGGIAGFISYLIIKAVYNKTDENSMLHNADMVKMIAAKRAKSAEKNTAEA